MIRFALIAYLSLTTFLGPSLCCCRAQQVVSMAESSDTCCRKSASTLSRGESPIGKRATEQPVSGGGFHKHGHDGQKCPCGKGQSNLIATATVSGSLADSVDSVQQASVIAGDLLLASFALGAVKQFLLLQRLPAALSGRDMLRVYQILRC